MIEPSQLVIGGWYVGPRLTVVKWQGMVFVDADGHVQENFDPLSFVGLDSGNIYSTRKHGANQCPSCSVG